MSGLAKRVLLVLLVAALVSSPAVATVETSAKGGTCAPAPVASTMDFEPGADPVRVIVVYESDAVRRACGDSAVSTVGGQMLERRPTELVPMSVARVDPGAITALERRPDIVAVERDTVIHGVDAAATSGSAAVQQLPWGIDRVNGTDAATLVSDAEMADVDVAVLDSGIDLDHPDLDDNLAWGVDLIDGANRTGLQYTDDVLDHGTHVAGTIAAEDNGQGVVGMAPNVSLYSIRVLNGSNSGMTSQVVEGVERAVRGPDGRLGTEDDAEVLSMSLGSYSGGVALEGAIREASEHAVVVAAAGNNGNGVNEVLYPAKYPETIAVAATDRNDETTGFSSEGPAVDIAAPGYGVLSTVPPELADGSEYDAFSGTSMAAPHVSGAAALLFAQDLADGSRDLTPADVRDQLRTTALDIHADGVDERSGAGRLRALRAMETDSTDDPPTASFRFEPTTPTVGELVTFDASASTDDRGIDSYNWTIGSETDSETSSTLNRTFTANGTYEVTLTVVDTDGQTNTTTRNVTVQSNDPPTAAFDVVPATPYVNQTVTFDASASTDDSAIASYNWTVGATRVNETSPTFTGHFTSNTTYEASLTVVDRAGLTDTVTRNVTVLADEPPTARFDVTPEPPYVNRTVTFDASNATDDRSIATYEWTIDGVPVARSDPTLTEHFETTGRHHVSLTVVDAAGQTNTTSRTVTVQPGLTIAAPTVTSPSQNGTVTSVSASVSIADVAPDRAVEGELLAAVTINGTAENATVLNVTDGSTVDLTIDVAPGAVGNYTVAVTGTATIDGTTFTATSGTTALRVVTENTTVVTPVDGTTPTDVDDDGRYEDIDGDGDGTLFDALAYYNNRNSETIRSNPQFFDFDGDGDAGDLFDALALYNVLTS